MVVDPTTIDASRRDYWRWYFHTFKEHYYLLVKYTTVIKKHGLLFVTRNNNKKKKNNSFIRTDFDYFPRKLI